MTRRFDALYFAALLFAAVAQAAPASAQPTPAPTQTAAPPQTPAQSQSPAQLETPARAETPGIETFFAAADLDQAQAEPARRRLAAAWDDGYAAVLLDMIDLMRRTSFVDPISWVRLNRLARFLEEQTGQDFGLDIDAWPISSGPRSARRSGWTKFSGAAFP
jgi:hypothetical protein